MRKRITRHEYGTESLASLAQRYSDEKIIAALKNYRTPMDIGRPSYGSVNAKLVWTTIEWMREHKRTPDGKAYSVKRACEELATEMKPDLEQREKWEIFFRDRGEARSSDAYGVPLGWKRLWALHASAQKEYETDPGYKRELDLQLAELRGSVAVHLNLVHSRQRVAMVVTIKTM